MTRDLARPQAETLKAGADHYRAYVGPPRQYDVMGATQFRLLTALGLRETHSVLDIGCGSLRAGRLLLVYLEPGRYCGIEPNTWLVDDAIEREIGRELVTRKAPRFSASTTFDASEFQTTFDFIVAQSIFSHAGPDMVATALQRAKDVLATQGLFLATFILHGADDTMPVEADGWTYPGCTSYRRSTILALLASAGLTGRSLPWFHPRQTWFAIAHTEAALPPEQYDHHLSGAVLRDEAFAASLQRD